MRIGLKTISRKALLLTAPLAALACSLLLFTTGCTSTSYPKITHMRSPEMGRPAIPVQQGSAINTAVTLAPVCHRGQLCLPAGTVLQYSFPTPYPYSPWRPVYKMRLPGRSTWWPCTAVLSKSGMAYFTYFAIPTNTLDSLRRACSRRPAGCCPYGPQSGLSTANKNPIKPIR
jgi:hypothetical protein